MNSFPKDCLNTKSFGYLIFIFVEFDDLTLYKRQNMYDHSSMYLVGFSCNTLSCVRMCKEKSYFTSLNYLRFKN